MTRLVLVRHGESVWHAENRYAGISDIALTPLGVRQADWLAGWAGEAGLSSVWASTLSRSIRTAEPCAQAVGAPLRTDERLRELAFGDAEGLTADEMSLRFPQARDDFRADPVAHHLPGGEDPVKAATRFTECLRDIAAEHPGERVLVVAHTTVIRLALCQLIGVPLREYRRLFPFLRNCALTEISLYDDHTAVLEFNSPLPGAPS
ncbi:histidine phosphatase family protein [Nonomuraea sp. NPDC049152]|uniref:histidine phosphatase family protein n=1 Tax=Nonomuraea sp. NPDC049152 TaxID=3154350 RepID=UPI0033CD6027